MYTLAGTDRERAANNMSVYSSSVQMLECKVGEPYGHRSEGILNWKEINPKVDPNDEKSLIPKGRADTEVVYDLSRQRLLFFGGWANRVSNKNICSSEYRSRQVVDK
jgi:hypothetical protein